MLQARLRRLLAIAAGCGFAALPAQNCHDFAAIAPIAQDLLSQFPLQGSSCLRVDQRGSTVYEQAFGSFTLQEVVPIASASKTLSAVVLMSLCDSGVVSLDDRVGLYLPEWNTGLRAQITLRMCFTHTAGLPGNHPAIGDNSITLRAAAQQLATVPLEYVPGTRFSYGGVSMHVAGAVCEVASGQSWSQLFTQRVATPLQFTATDYFAFGVTLNPRIAGGVRSNLRDFAVLCDMLRDDGSWNGVAVLSPASADELLRAQTVGIPILNTPHPEAAPYGIGIWVDRRDSLGRTRFASGIGAFGFTGWVDRDHDASGAFLVRYLNQQTYPYVLRIWAALDDTLLPDGVGCVGTGSPVCAAGTWLNGDSATNAGNVDFAVRAARAPANAPGVLLLGDPAPVGLPFVDLVGHVGPSFTVASSWLADADGRATLAAPLAAALVGSGFGLQSVWLSPAGCAQLGLQASHALRLDVLP
jgi:CubicO group peptidase (beta-lactamase class C family)